jgi:glycosyltransferase involved in cell wall biosynthesis
MHTNISPKRRPRLLFIVNTAHFFISHRLALAAAALRAGFDVHVAAPGSEEEVQTITKAGCDFHPLTFPRTNGGIGTEAYAWFRIAFLVARTRPDVLHAVTIKPVIYGGIAAKLLGVGGVLFSITGLRYRSNCTAEPVIAKKILAWLTKRALNHKNSRVIFQNNSDLEKFVKEGLCSPESAVLIPGSGVAVGTEYHRTMTPSARTRPVVLLAARMIEGKGVREYAAAAKAINTPVPRARFLLAGRVDRNEPGAVPIHEIIAWAQAGWIEWLGLRSDVPALLAEADIACLPSHGGEGVPRFLLEALATADAIVTTDVPGCRDLVVNDVNGKLVQPASASGLQAALSELIGDAQRTARMGEMSSKMLSADHELGSVVRKHLDLYTSLLASDDADRLRQHSPYSSSAIFAAKAPIQTASWDNTK